MFRELKRRLNIAIPLYASEWKQEMNQIIDNCSPYIMCSERLPTHAEYVANGGRFIVTDGNRNYVTHFDIYETKKFGVPQLNGFCEDNCVIAWMNIPDFNRHE